MRKTHYHDTLRANIQKHVSYSACPTLDNMIARAREKEIDLEHLRKRKAGEGRLLGFRGRNPRDPTPG